MDMKIEQYSNIRESTDMDPKERNMQVEQNKSENRAMLIRESSDMDPGVEQYRSSNIDPRIEQYRSENPACRPLPQNPRAQPLKSHREESMATDWENDSFSP